jgi:hypothetical protein
LLALLQRSVVLLNVLLVMLNKVFWDGQKITLN